MESAIILDGALKSALTAVRSLGARGIPAVVGCERASGMALHSRYVQSRFVYPSPYTDQDAFVRSVKAEAVRMGGKPVVYAFSDATFLSLYTHREELGAYMTLIYPPDQSVEIAFDKAATYSLAKVSGVPTIQTYTPATEQELIRVGEAITYPAVIKTRRSVTWRNGAGHFGTASFVHAQEHLSRQWRALYEQHGEVPLIQDFVYGDEYGVEMMTHQGKILARVVHRRLRSLSPTGGASVLKETVGEGYEASLMSVYAERLVSALSWTGPIMVEFKVDADTHEPRLMEINGRFWGSLPLAVAADVDMPYLYYLLAQGQYNNTGIITAREGVTSRHTLGDILNLVRVFVARDPLRSVLYPKRSRALRDFFNLPVGTKNDVWSRKDPMPACYEVIDMIKKHLCK